MCYLGSAITWKFLGMHKGTTLSEPRGLGWLVCTRDRPRGYWVHHMLTRKRCGVSLYVCGKDRIICSYYLCMNESQTISGFGLRS
jgi:hypothetical protein